MVIIACCNNLLVLGHWIFCADRTKHYFIQIKDQFWVQMIEVAIVLSHLNVVFDNIVWQCCQSLYLHVSEKECRGQSIDVHLNNSLLTI